MFKLPLKERPVGVQIGERIRASRKALGLTQTELGELAGRIAPGELSRFENGHRTPTLDTLRRLADALGLELRDLLDLDAPLRGPLPPDLRERLERLRQQPAVVLQRACRVIDAILDCRGVA